MPDNIPESGDVVIHNSGSHAAPSFAIRAVPGPDQFGCATRGEAERMARTARLLPPGWVDYTRTSRDLVIVRLGRTRQPHAWDHAAFVREVLRTAAVIR
jgi:hypothetical protein